MRAGIGASVLTAIGSTPLVELSRLRDPRAGRILAKLEYLNPGGSKKDRIALRMIEDAETSGALRRGQPVVELTSGNTGTGLAIVCAVKGYPFVAVMSAGKLDPTLVDGYVTVDDIAAIDAARRLAQQEGIFAGFSAGACLAAAEATLRDRHGGQTALIVVADSGMKYLSTDLWPAHGADTRAGGR